MSLLRSSIYAHAEGEAVSQRARSMSACAFFFGLQMISSIKRRMSSGFGPVLLQRGGKVASFRPTECVFKDG